MTHQPAALFAPLTIAILALAGCATAAPADTDTDAVESDGNSSSSQNTGGSPDKGHATVTIDGETWEYPDFMCAVGYEATSSDTYSFSGTSYRTTAGDKIQFSVDVSDPSGQNRLSGDGVSYEIGVSDYGNTSNPSVHVSVSGESGVTISGNSVKVSGEFAEISMVSHTVEADAVCQ